MTQLMANNSATSASAGARPHRDRPHAPAADSPHADRASEIRPSFVEIAEMLARLHATHAALGAAQYRVSQLVHANLVLERHARCLAEELDHARRHGLHDPLTGLANRPLLADRLQLAIRQARREEVHIAVLLIDLDGFKTINDIHGHTMGDEVLCETARRTLSSIRDCDTACRYGGDEFVIVLSNIYQREDAQAVAEKIRSEIARPLVLNAHTVEVTATLGMSLFPTDGRTADELIERADRAMYGTKALRGRVEGNRLLHAHPPR